MFGTFSIKIRITLKDNRGWNFAWIIIDIVRFFYKLKLTTKCSHPDIYKHRLFFTYPIILSMDLHELIIKTLSYIYAKVFIYIIQNVYHTHFYSIHFRDCLSYHHPILQFSNKTSQLSYTKTNRSPSMFSLGNELIFVWGASIKIVPLPLVDG